MDTVAPTADQVMGTPYNQIGTAEHVAVSGMFIGDPARPLSGYLAGKERGGVYVQALEDKWAETFKVKHAIACNSATSGLLAAAVVAGLKPGDKFSCPAMTMSATAAAPMMAGAHPVFTDVESDTFGDNGSLLGDTIKVMMVTNLFGHPAQLTKLRKMADQLRRIMIEDNAQSPFAMAEWGPLESRYAGTIGHMGVFSLNVHKHFQCGEGGVVVTNDDGLSEDLRAFINHGEHTSSRVGINLRMPETSAAIALTQLRRGLALVEGRRAQAEMIIQAIGQLDHVRAPVVREQCTHSYYTIPFLIDRRDRGKFCASLRAAGVPVVEGYQEPLYRMPAFSRMRRKDGCPVAEDLHDRRLFYIENCARTFSRGEIRRIGDAFKRAAEMV